MEMNKIMSHWRYAGIEYDDIANGKGLGAVFFTQYCPHHCPECHNPQTWDIDGGMPFTEDVLRKLLKYYQDIPYASRLTFSGGDPISSPDLTYYILSKFRNLYPDKRVWLYTGFLFEQIAFNTPTTHTEEIIHDILKMCDVVVDGEFIVSQRDITLQFAGSKNQRIIDVRKSMNKREVIMWT